VICGPHSLHKPVFEVPHPKPLHTTTLTIIRLSVRFRTAATRQRAIRLVFHASLNSTGKRKLYIVARYFGEDNAAPKIDYPTVIDNFKPKRGDRQSDRHARPTAEQVSS
jgi:hypothetical protein